MRRMATLIQQLDAAHSLMAGALKARFVSISPGHLLWETMLTLCEQLGRVPTIEELWRVSPYTASEVAAWCVEQGRMR